MSLHNDQIPVLAQVLEDAEGCRAVVSSMLFLDLPADVVDELAACDERLSALIVAVRGHLGPRCLGEGYDAA
ncbi:MAG TPA: hypothetical protein VL117_05980 [Thermoleophilia bacterium]|nr:hypothetical protein [Thermoleophilia bacterium]